MDEAHEELMAVNRQTFEAEAKRNIGEERWDAVLQRVLAEDFTIRRSNPSVPDQSREQMIKWIDAHPVADRNLVSEAIRSWCIEALGVVVSPVTMRDTKGELHRYQNIKVFEKRPPGQWRCVYWQVTEAPVQ